MSNKNDPTSELEAAQYELRFAEQNLASAQELVRKAEQKMVDKRRVVRELNKTIENSKNLKIKRNLRDAEVGDVLISGYMRKSVEVERIEGDLIYVKRDSLPISMTSGNRYGGPGYMVDNDPFRFATEAEQNNYHTLQRQVAEGDGPAGIPGYCGAFSNLHSGLEFLLHGVVRCSVLQASRGFNSPWSCEVKLQRTDFTLVFNAEQWNAALQNGFVNF